MAKWLRRTAVVCAMIGAVAVAYYSIEPWAVTFIDDGPYYSTRFTGPIDDLPLESTTQLRRFGRLKFVLESRLLPTGNGSVLVLKDGRGELQWARLPVKPDGELGPLALRAAYLTWYGGWRVAISPAKQEGGHLYLSCFGNFRFFNHSW